MTDIPKRGIMGTMSGPRNRNDSVVCGADFVVEYAASTLYFGHCSLETPGTPIWSNSDELKCDDRDNPVVLRRDVLPLPNTELPDLRRDACPKCKTAGSLVLSVPDECECPRCHKGVLKKVSYRIQ
jgi:hypothetical protein